MKRELFERLYAPRWRELEQILDSLEKPWRSVDAERFPELYRQVCHHLALARTRCYGADLEQHLNRLVLRGHQQLYASRPSGWGAMLSFVLHGLPRLVRSNAGLFWLSFALLFLPVGAMQLAVTLEPELVYSVVDPEQLREFEEMYAERPTGDRRPDADVLMFGYYIRNNIGVAFRTFAAGIFLGVGSVYVLLYNGLLLGALTAHLQNLGRGENIWSFVVGHGGFELMAIVLAGMAGIKLGLGLIKAGRKSRVRSLRDAAAEAVRLVYGVAGMLVVAAFLEAFWSSTGGIDARFKYLVGALLATLLAGYLLLAGRRHGA